MFKLETIRKVVGIANDTRKELETHINDIKICVSSGNTKIGRVMNVSLMPIITCSNCHECMYYCYDLKACARYSDTVINARMRNTVLWIHNPEKYFGDIRKKLARRRTNFYFRWHVAGDIPNMDYFENMVSIARDFPNFLFWTYTKNYDVVNTWCLRHGRCNLPKNFIIMFSEWDGLAMINPFNFPEFSCKLKDGNKNHPVEYFLNLYRCPGNCDICKKINRGCIAGETTYADEH